MAAQTIGTILGRISSMTAGLGYTQAREPFGVDLQPNQELDVTFWVKAAHEETDEYFGYAQAEIERVRVSLARKVKRDSHAAYSALLTDLNSLVPLVLRDGVGADYNASLSGWDVPDPEPAADFLVGWAEFAVDYDRAL